MLSRIEEGMGEMAVIYMCRYIYYVVLKYYRGRLALGALISRKPATTKEDRFSADATEPGVVQL